MGNNDLIIKYFLGYSYKFGKQKRGKNLNRNLITFEFSDHYRSYSCIDGI